MPAPQAAMMKQLAKLQFMSFNIRLPLDWNNPDHQHQYEMDPATMAQSAMWLFKPATAIKEHVESAKKNSQLFSTYIDGICDAICSAWSQWQASATMVGVVINAVTAAVGQVVGMPWTPVILGLGPKTTPQYMKYTTAIAQAIGMGWLQYTASIKVPGLPWYPAFAAFPGPVTPPTPNVPCPVATLTQVPAPVSKAMLKQQMISLLADPRAQHHQELFDSVAHAFDACFKIWQVSTMVTNVLGFGPIPTFAPPYVPLGPVVGGVGNMTPGGFV